MWRFSKNNSITALILGVCLTALVFGVTFADNLVLANEKPANVSYDPDKIIVVYENGIGKKETAKVTREMGGKDVNILGTLQGRLATVVTLDSQQTVKKAIKDYEHDQAVAYAQPNYKYEISVDKWAGVNDEYRYDLWHFGQVEVERAWEVMRGVSHTKVKVACLDTGIDLSHPDLKTNVNAGLCADTSTGQVKPFQGDDMGHGTHVAGILGATANNKIGVAGVGAGSDNSIIQIFGVDVFRADGSAYTDGIVSGIKYAEDHGAKVINMSLAYQTDAPMDAEDQYFEDSVKGAVQKGITVVCAAGNQSNAVTTYPSDFDEAISVIATDDSGSRWADSNYGQAKDISAPGVDIYISFTSPRYKSDDGTSMAAPIVSSVAAMLYSIKPTISVKDVKSTLYRTAIDIGAPGKDANTGYGNVNAYQAVKALALEAPTWIDVKSGILSWEAVNGASRYRVEIYQGKGRIYRSGKLGKTSLKLSNLNPETHYTITIIAMDEKNRKKSSTASFSYKTPKKQYQKVLSGTDWSSVITYNKSVDEKPLKEEKIKIELILYLVEMLTETAQYRIPVRPASHILYCFV